jgi:nucleotidyltransferase/DNA polymerase involved in DNA repair
VVVSLSFEPFALWWARRSNLDGTAPHVALAGERVVACDAAARRAGIVPGMGRTAARARSTELQEVAAAAPELDSAWRGLLMELYDHTPWLEATALGVVALRLNPAEALQLAADRRARAGAAESREHARLLALAAHPGRLRAGGAAEVERLPLLLLRGLGVAAGTLERLRWLGLERLGELQRWSPGQIGALLGPEAPEVLRHLHGPYRYDVPPFRPPASIRSRLAFDDAACEPAVLEPALMQLANTAAAQLGDRAAGILTLHADVQGIAFRAARVAKVPLRDPGTIARLAYLALTECGAQPLGVDGLILELSELHRPAHQGALWPQRERLDRAVSGVERRFPGSLLRIETLDPYALAFEHRAHLTPWRLEGGKQRARRADQDRGRTPQRVAQPRG